MHGGDDEDQMLGKQDKFHAEVRDINRKFGPAGG